MMQINDAEIKLLKERLIAEYCTEPVREGMVVTITCSEELVWENIKTGETHYGCGEELVKFIYTGDEDSTWDIAADIYIAHLHNAHSYGVSINPVDVTG